MNVCLKGGSIVSIFDYDEVMAKANNLDAADEMRKWKKVFFQFYNEESIAFCGLDDFEKFLKAYQHFVQTYH